MRGSVGSRVGAGTAGGWVVVGLGFEGREEGWETVFSDWFAEGSGCHGVSPGVEEVDIKASCS